MRRFALGCLVMVLVAACSSSALFGPAVSPGPSSGAVPSFNLHPTIERTAMATVPDPSGVFVSGQAMSGVGWRVLLATRHGWTLTVPSGVSLPGTVFDNNWLDVPDTSASLARLWGFLNVSDAPPVDLNREIVVALGFLTGAGPICGQVRLDRVAFDAAGRVAVQLQDASSFETLPPASGDAVSACAAVGNPTEIVLALDRFSLPPSPLRLRLDGPGPYPVETEVTLSRRDTSAAGPPPSPAVTAASYPLSPPTAIQSWLATNTQIGFRPLTPAEHASVRVSAKDAEQTVFAVPGPGYGFGTDHFTWTKIGCVFLGWFTAQPMPSVGYVAPTYPAYLVQVLAPPVAAYPGENVEVGVVDARTGQRGTFYGSGGATFLGTTCGVTP